MIRKDGQLVTTRNSLLLDFIETHWEAGTKMRFIYWKKQNVVLRIHFIEINKVNVKMRTGGILLAGNEIPHNAFSIAAWCHKNAPLAIEVLIYTYVRCDRSFIFSYLEK